MAASLAVILLLGLPANKAFKKLKMPGLLGMLILGIVIGPLGAIGINSSARRLIDNNVRSELNAKTV